MAMGVIGEAVVVAADDDIKGPPNDTFFLVSLFSATLSTRHPFYHSYSEREFCHCRKSLFEILLSDSKIELFLTNLDMLPLSLLKTAVNHPMLVELKNGETYNGHLVQCDNWMNLQLRVSRTFRNKTQFLRIILIYRENSNERYT